MKVVFYGLGSIGQRHAKILQENSEHELFALRTRKSDVPAQDLNIKEIQSWDQVDAIHPEIAFITNPTALHIETAIECAKRGMALFIEKPIGSNTDRLQELCDIIVQKKLPSYVAYVLRFHPVIRFVKEYMSTGPFLHMHVYTTSFLPNWRKGRNHLQSYSANKNLGGGVVFDLSHEIDYVDYLLDGITGLSGQSAKRTTVTVDAEDFADILVESEKGPANIHMNFFSHVNQRSLRVDFEDKTVVGDLLRNKVEIFEDGKLIDEHEFSIVQDDIYKKQMDYFFENLSNSNMMNNVTEASGLFKKICQFKESDSWLTTSL